MFAEKCAWCGGPIHDGVYCPRIKAISYHEDGVTISRIEVFEPAKAPAVESIESDKDYRGRLMLGAKESVLAPDITEARGARLDALGAMLDVKRHGT